MCPVRETQGAGIQVPYLDGPVGTPVTKQSLLGSTSIHSGPTPDVR